MRLRPAQGRGPGDRVESPYDTEARSRAKSGTGWTGHMARLTETCDPKRPRLVVHAEAVPANVHEAMRIDAIHDALAAKGLAPSEHPACAGHVSGHHIVAARERHGIELVGPPRPDLSWQAQEEDAFRAAGFAVDWESRRVRCPEGRDLHHLEQGHQASLGPALHPRRVQPGGLPSVPLAPALHARTRPPARPPAPRRARGGRRRQGAAEDRDGPGDPRPAPRRGGHDLARRVRAFGLRRARHHGLAKAVLQSIVTAAAIDLDRLAAWLEGRPLAPTRTSRFAA